MWSYQYIMKSYSNIRDHITMLYDHITISCHEIMRSQHEWKPKDTKRPFKALLGNRKPPKGKLSAPSSKLAHKINKKICNSRKKTGPRERLQEILRWKLRMLSSYTFYYGILQKSLRNFDFSAILSNFRKTGISELRNFLRWSQFGRPTPVWGPAAVGEAPRSLNDANSWIV